MIEQLMTHMQNGDYEKFSGLLSYDCLIHDYSPQLLGRKAVSLWGRPMVHMYYHHNFVFRSIKVANAKIIDEKTARFLIAHNNTYVPVVGTIEKYGESGLVREFVIRPA